MAKREAPKKTGSTRRRVVNLIAGVLAAAVLVAFPFAYWRVVNFVPRFVPPARTQLEPNGYELAAASLRRLPPLPQDQEPLSPARRKSIVARSRGVLEEVRACFSLVWQAPRPPLKYPDTEERFESGARLFVLESQEADEHGHPERALSGCLDAIELGGNAGRGGAVSERYTAQECQVTGLEQLQRIYPRLPASAIRRALPRLRRIRKEWPTIRETLEEERILAAQECTRYLDTLSSKSVWEQLELAQANAASVPSVLPSMPANLWAPPPAASHPEAWQQALTPHLIAIEEVKRYYRELGVSSSRPAPEGVPVPSLSNVWARQFARQSFTGRYRGEWARNNLALAEVALAARARRLESGRSPTSVEQLGADLLPELPVDVWGQPLRLCERRGQTVVYSLGPDGRDERGRAVDPSSVISGGGGDLVFGKLCSSDWQEPRRARVGP